MKTIRGKIISFLILCLAFVSFLSALYYENVFSLRYKVYTIERFDDLLNDVLELRRYEKNYLFYRDTTSIQIGMDYLSRIENSFKVLKDDITGLVGEEECRTFALNLTRYESILNSLIKLKNTDIDQNQEASLRSKGKSLVDFAQEIIRIKRRKIGKTLERAMVIPLACMAFLLVLIVVIIRFVNRGILKPLLLVEKATEQVARDSFTPILYDKEKQNEITRLIASFNKMAQELESRQDQLLQSRKLASIGTFTSGIAHELNNPLNNISITAEAMMMNVREMSEKELTEMIHDILSQADRAGQVVKNLLEFSRTERHLLIDLDIRDVIERTLRLIKNQLTVSNIRIEKKLTNDMPLIRGKRHDLQQAFVNILINAVQAMPEGGTVRIWAGRGPNGYIQIDLSDTGTGIGPEALEHIFDPFYTTKTSGNGTGLGLSLVYSIIRTHGGYIEVKSKEGQGSTFSIYLPVTGKEESSQDGSQGSDC